MKTRLLIALLVWLAVPLSAQKAWTVRSVPNTRLESNLIHVSDPNDILSDSCEQLINTSLEAIRDQADVFVVALNSIGDADIDVFANELFNDWGIGDAELNNGVLIVLAKEQHDLKFETGYGAEETLPDALCQRIFEDYMVPFFKEDDYEGGLCSAVTQILEVYGGAVPDGLIPTLPSKRGNDGGGDGEDAPLSFVILGLLVFFMPIVALVSYLKSSRTSTKISSLVNSSTVVNGVRYVDGNQKKWNGDPWGGVGCLKALMYGLSIFLFMGIAFAIESARVGGEGETNTWRILLYTLVMYLTWICLRQNMRSLRAANKLAKGNLFPQAVYQEADKNKLTRFTRWAAIWVGWIFILIFRNKIKNASSCQCADCGAEMHAFGKFPFSAVQRREQELKSLNYEPYICQYGHVTILKSNGVNASRYSVCPSCQGRTEKEVDSRMVEEANYDHSGTKEVTCQCEYCGATRKVERMIPQLYRSLSGSTSGGYSSSSSRSYHSSSSHHSSHGSFGGGRSGGGGYHGKW